MSARFARLVTTRHEVLLARPIGPLRVAHLSDIHGATFGERNERLVSRVSEAAPDLIAVSGDVLRRHVDVTEASVRLLRDLSALAPVVVSRGNHDLGSREWRGLQRGTSGANVFLLVNESRRVDLRGNTVVVAALDDLWGFRSAAEYERELHRLARACASAPGPRILLSHRPEYMRLYRETPFDLVLAGHAHGGQVRLPGLGAIWAPEQGFLPRHADGAHQENETTLVVSRGLGPSSMPVRIFNPPEVIVIDVVPDPAAAASATAGGEAVLTG